MDMTVTAIEPYPKGKGRVSVYLNDRFAFVLYKGELSQYGLEPGTVVDEDLYDRIMNETIILRAKKRGMNLLQKMDRTEADVRRKLSEGGYPPAAVDAAIEYLRSFHYIDDMRYASDYIRFKSQTFSRRQIMMKLSEKGISKDIIETAFSEFDTDNGDEGNGYEKALIRKLILKRCPQGAGSLDFEGRRKLISYLYGKGFSLSDIDDVLDIT